MSCTNYYKDTILAQVEEHGQHEVTRTLLLDVFHSEEEIDEFFEQNGLHGTRLADDIILIARKR